MKNICAVLLAAGDGTRMKSEHPKVLCEVLFKPMILWVADALSAAGIDQCVAVLGAGHDQVKAVLPAHFDSVMQPERRGTGHAVMSARKYIENGKFSDVAVVYGDAPFVSAEDLKKAYIQHQEQGNAVTVMSARVHNPAGYGRIVRTAAGVSAIIEQADADNDTLLIDEINAGAYWFNAEFLLSCFDQLTSDNANGEYYLTDTVSIAVKERRHVDAYLAHSDTALGANDRKGLALLNSIARSRILDRLLGEGVDIPFPDQVVVGPEVRVGPDTRLLPGSILRGKTTIGKGCEIGPNSQLTNATVGDGTQVIASFVDSSVLGSRVRVGPMSNIRPGCKIEDSAKVGDFVEIKNSVIGEKTSVAHLSYVGDTDMGAHCNIGCGVVTVNYDGAGKYRTAIGNGAFIGCNTNIIAPVTLGDRVYCAAGTTVTDDVPNDALVIGRARQTIKENWNDKGARYKKGAVE